MAGCYHDKQDFKSDLDIEVAREGDILEYGQDLDEIECEKNPGHRGFIPLKDLTLDHLPNAVRNKGTLDGIRNVGSIVVRIVRDGLIGSGYVEKYSRAPLFCIKTNNHVVNTDDGVRRCTVEFHYDSKDRSSVVTSKGVKLIQTSPERDLTSFLFCPIPDFLYQLDWNDSNDIRANLIIMYKDSHIVNAKTLTIFPSLTSLVNLNNSLIDLMFLSWHTGSISYINSPYFKFKPITSNIKELPSIEIHIDGDNGKSRVISGDVVKFGDDFVVKISEAIFQDEVTKCKLVLNGDVIGRGTRLYFEEIKLSNIFGDMCKVDSADLLQQWDQDNCWSYDCDKPKDVDSILNMTRQEVCCIGHPHGSIKMVTFGYLLETSHERFDRQCRRIDTTGKQCQCKTVSCYNYSCKTCKGSSGSPIIFLGKIPHLSTLLTHFMGKRLEALLPDGEEIENKNSAWCAKLKCKIQQ